MTLDEMIQLAEDQARRTMIGTKEELAPMWLTLDVDGKVEIVATPWSGGHEKELTIELMRVSMRARQIVAYSLLTEAWMARASAEEVKTGGYIGKPPSERADRVEAVVAMAANKAGEHRYKNWQTIRDKKGRCKELRPLVGPEDQLMSIFDNLLDDHRRSN
jgi:hypothetical protein